VELATKNPEQGSYNLLPSIKRANRRPN